MKTCEVKFSPRNYSSGLREVLICEDTNLVRAQVERREYGLKFSFLICVAWSYGISRAPKYLKELRPGNIFYSFYPVF